MIKRRFLRATSLCVLGFPAWATAHGLKPRAPTRPPVLSIVSTAQPPNPLLLRDILLAQALPAELRRARLLALAGAAPDHDGQRGAAIVHALGRLHDPLAAQQAVAEAEAATAHQPITAQMAYADALAAIGADPLPLPERPASAAALALALAPPPASAVTKLADPAASLAFDQAILRRDPGNAQARATAVQAALQLGAADVARALVADALALDPNDPHGWVLAALVAGIDHDAGTAVLDLRRARELRVQQLGSDTGDTGDSLAGATAAPVSATSLAALPQGNPWRAPPTAAPPSTASYETAQSFYTNPFRNAPDQTGSAPSISSSDPLTQQIDSSLAALQAEVAPQVAGELSISGRSGQNGLSGVAAVALPMEATFSPDGFGKLRVLVQPTLLFTGAIGNTPSSLAEFGTLAFGVTGSPTGTALGFAGVTPGSQDAKGVGLDLDYANGWFDGDVGTTPLGFRIHNVVGGVQLTPRLNDNLALRLVAERRAVTDSVFSYAGQVDPRTGNKMGGVVKNRLFAQLELTDDQDYYYLGLGGSRLRGENVASNTEIEAGAGASYPVWSSHTDDVRIGLDLVYFGFDKNLEYFSLGQGGYFSPQSYFAALVPLSYSEKLGRLSYQVSGSIGIQTYHQDSSPLFPTNDALQAQLVTAAAGIRGLATSYGGANTIGPSGHVQGEIQYEVAPNVNIGGQASFERAGDFTQGEGLLYARYIFDGGR